MSGGVADVHVSNLTVWDSAEGLRIKTGMGRGGYIRNIEMVDSTIDGSKTAFMYNHVQCTLWRPPNWCQYLGSANSGQYQGCASYRQQQWESRRHRRVGSSGYYNYRHLVHWCAHRSNRWLHLWVCIWGSAQHTSSSMQRVDTELATNIHKYTDVYQTWHTPSKYWFGISLISLFFIYNLHLIEIIDHTD